MPITEALKKLIKTITGKDAVGETIEELIQNLNDNYPEDSGGQSGIDGVTMLHGHGAGAVPLPSGVVFPDETDVTVDGGSTPAPYVNVVLLYIDGDNTDDMTGETTFIRVLANKTNYDKTDNTVDFHDIMPSDETARFRIGAGEIELVSANRTAMSHLDINDNTDWMMMIVDMRQNGD